MRLPRLPFPTISQIVSGPPPELPPVWRIRRVDGRWWVLRLQPIRHTFYFKIADFDTHDEALLYICKREGNCEL